MNNLPICLIQYICEYLLDFEISNLASTCKTYYYRLKIHKMHYATNKLITDGAIAKPMFSELRELDYCPLLVNLSNLQQLVSLRLNRNYDNNSIANLKPKILHRFINDKITVFPNSLEELYFEFGSSSPLFIDPVMEHCLAGLNLTVLEMNNANFIYEIGHMSNLRVLHCNGHTYIRNKQMKLLNLTHLYCNDVTHLSEVPDTLQVLHCARYSGIDNDSIANLNLTELNFTDNPYITQIGHMTNLQVLYCENSNIESGEFANLKLIILNCNNCPNVSHVSHFNLIKLSCDGNCDVRDDDLENMTSLRTLSFNGNPRITKVSHLVNLKKLYCRNSNITNYEIIQLLRARNNTTRLVVYYTRSDILDLDAPEFEEYWRDILGVPY